jgi:prepilin-type N-terminal cleavage/methylation domain-containing protein
MSMKIITDDRGFTLIELLVASVITMLVLGGAVALTSQMQLSFRKQVEDAAAEQEGRYALDWVSKLIRAAGNNPYNIANSQCPAASTPFDAVIFDPLVTNVIRVQTDSNPPDGLLGGPAGTCTQANEDVTISFDATTNSITFLDNNLGGGASIRTDAVIAGLEFKYRDAAHVVTTTAANVVYIETLVTVRTRTIDPQTGAPMTHVLSEEVRLRGRNY